MRKIVMSVCTGVVFGALLYIGVVPELLPVQHRPHKLFVYGTLENNFLRYYACRCIVPTRLATLENYRQTGLTITPDADSVVTGSIMYLSDKELKAIDRYENIPVKYKRTIVNIENKPHWVYIRN